MKKLIWIFVLCCLLFKVHAQESPTNIGATAFDYKGYAGMAGEAFLGADKSLNNGDTIISIGFPYNLSIQPFFYLAENGVTVKCKNCSPGDKGIINGVEYEVVDNVLLKERIAQGADVKKLCTSMVTDMKDLFKDNASFNSDISTWDVSRVTDMSGMFQGAKSFNGNIKHWDVSKVVTMGAMFQNATSFKQNVSSWDVSEVVNMNAMFKNAKAFNCDLSSWHVNKATDMQYMFYGASSFANDLSLWSPDNINSLPEGFYEGSALRKATLPKWLFYLADNGITVKYRGNKVGAKGTVNGKLYEVVNNSLLIQRKNQGADMSTLCTSLVTSMADLFSGKWEFNGDISTWDVSNVTNMSNTFANASQFNGDISQWDVSNVTNMSSMFANASQFNRDISCWDVSNVSDMSYMFNNAGNFNGDITTWDVGNVIDMERIFYYASSFSKDLSGWCVSKITSEPLEFWYFSKLNSAKFPKWGTCTPFLIAENGVVIYRGNTPGDKGTVKGVTYEAVDRQLLEQRINEGGDLSKLCTSLLTNMDSLFFNKTEFNENISTWDVSNVESMLCTFKGASSFNQDISSWDVSKVKNMSGTFNGAISFNQNLSSWNVSSVVDMSYLFKDAATFNKDISTWEVSNVEDMKGAFAGASSFNQDIGSWDLSNVSDMSNMFNGATLFNRNIANWKVSGVTNMSHLFKNASSFNQDISGWNVSVVNNMCEMFAGASAFNQILNSWDVSSVKDMSNMFNGATSFNEPLDSFNVSSVTNMANMFKNASAFNQDIYTWNIAQVNDMSGMFEGASAFNKNISNWCVSHLREQPSNFALNTALEINYQPQWGKCPVIMKADNNVTIIAVDCLPGTIGLVDGVKYEVVDKPLLVQRINEGADLSKLCTTHASDLSGIFKGFEDFNADISSWDVSNVTNMSEMFKNAEAFNQDLSSWDVSNVTNMSKLFQGASSFNADISSWDVSMVTDFSGMFSGASSFNKPIGSWDLQSATNLSSMFKGATAFNMEVVNWSTSKVDDMSDMFANASSFNQDIGIWDLSAVTNMSQMFKGALAFNQNIGYWDVSNVLNMSGLFYNASTFNQDIRNWSVSNVTKMDSMFKNASSFNQVLSFWCVSNIASEPANFSEDSGLSNKNHPNWGECPANIIVEGFDQLSFYSSSNYEIRAIAQSLYSLKGTDLPEGFSINDEALRDESLDVSERQAFLEVDKVQPGDYSFTITAYDIDNKELVESEINFSVPELSIEGLSQNPYRYGVNYISLNASEEVSNITWQVNGENSITETFDFFTAQSTDTVFVSCRYDGKNLNYREIFTFSDIELSIAQAEDYLVEGVSYAYSLEEDLAMDFGFIADSLVWYFDNDRLGSGLSVLFASESSGAHNMKAIAYTQGYSVESEANIDFVATPTISINNIETEYGKRVAIPFSIIGAPNYKEGLTYSMSGMDDFRAEFVEDSIVFYASVAGLTRSILYIYSPEKNLLAQQAFKIAIKPDIAFSNANKLYSLNSTFFRGGGACSNEITAWEWTFKKEGENAIKYYTQNPKVYLTSSGEYTVTLKGITKTGQSNSIVKTLSFEPMKGRRFVPAVLPDTIVFGNALAEKFEWEGGYKADYFSFKQGKELPGATLRYDGLFSWEPDVTEGVFEYEIESRVCIGEGFGSSCTSVVATQSFSTAVIDTRQRKEILIKDENGSPLKDVVIKVYDKKTNKLVDELVTNNSGIGISSNSEDLLYFMDRLYEFKLTADDFPNEFTKKFKTGDSKTLVYSFDSRTIEIADMIFEADRIAYDKGRDRYEMQNVTINNKISIRGEVVVEKKMDFRSINGNQAIYVLKTRNSIQLINVGGTKTVVSNPNNKEYYLLSEMIVPSLTAPVFSIDKACGLEMTSGALAFEEDEDTGELLVQFAAFPKLPWVLGDYILAKRAAYQNLILSFVNNDDSEEEDDESSIMNVINHIKDKAEEEQEDNSDDNKNKDKKKKSKLKSFSKGVMENSSFPTIEIIETFDSNGGNYEWKMEDLVIAASSGPGLTDLDMHYIGRENYLRCSAEISWAKDRLTIDPENVTLVDLDSMLNEQFDDSTLLDLPVTLKTDDGEVVYNSTYEEFVTLAADEDKRRGLFDKFTGFRITFELIDGKIQSVELTINVSIMIPSLNLELTSITGSLDGLNEGPFEMSLSCNLQSITPYSGFYEVRPIGLKLRPWTYFEGHGDFYLMDMHLADATIWYNTEISTLYAEMNANFFDILTGRVAMRIGNDPGFYATLALQTPNAGWLPWFVRGKQLGMVEAGMNTHRIAGRAKFRFGCGCIKWIGCACLIDASMGVGYDFDNDKFLWGGDTHVPKLVRKAYRGDTLEYAFDVSHDTRQLLLFLGNPSEGMIDFDLVNPSNKVLADDAFVTAYEEGMKTTIASIELPEKGTWTLKYDTVKYPGVEIYTMYPNNAPSGIIESPSVIDTTSTQLVLKYNDINDTLSIDLYVDTDMEGYDGKKIKSFQVFNNATMKIDYAPTDLKPGTYYFYHTITDGSGIPVSNYGQGGLLVKSNGVVPDPVGIKHTTQCDSLVVYWQTVDSSKVAYTIVELTEMVTGDVTSLSSIDSTVAFNDLKPGLEYIISAYNVGHNDDFSEELTLPAFDFIVENVNSKPKLAEAIQGKYMFDEEVRKAYAFKTVDLDGDYVDVTFVENLPKTMYYRNDSIVWTPEAGDAGNHTFNMVLGDGIDMDTVEIYFMVREQTFTKTELNFLSSGLYEADNMFIELFDLDNDSAEVEITLKNISKGDSINIVGSKVGEDKFLAPFQLSYQRRSVLPVSGGDTIEAYYEVNGERISTRAYFDETPQIVDNTPPEAITDMDVVDYSDDSVKVTFTVPVDRFDNGMISSPWVYDLRYAYSELDNEVVYFSSYKIETYEVGEHGDKDSLMIAKADLYDLDKNFKVWFNIKTGDTKFNYSAMSNTDSIYNIAIPANAEATMHSRDVVNVSWDGPSVSETDSFFVGTKVYRSFNANDFTLMGYSFTDEYLDTLDATVIDGTVKYAVEAYYQDQVTDSVYSNSLELDRYTNVTIKLLTESEIVDSLSSLKVELIPFDANLDTIRTDVDDMGTVYLAKVTNGKYTVIIIKDDHPIKYEDETIAKGNETLQYFLTTSNIMSLVTGTEYLGLSEYRIYPNPSNGIFTITIPDKDQLKTLRIFDAKGSLVLPASVDFSSSKKVVVTMNASDKGVFTVLVRMKSREISHQILIKE